MSDAAFLTAKGVHKIYRYGSKDVRAVNGIDLEIKRGKALAIVGPSGAGKSTLLHILGGLDKPTSGKIIMEEVDIYKLPDSQRARIRNRRIGFVFQFYNLLPEFTALENVMLPAMIKGEASRRSVRDKAINILESVGLSSRAHHRPAELSGGESQRVAIARAIINEPDVLLCDEPTGNLDSKTSQAIYELLFKLNNTALVIVTHDDKISGSADQTIRIKDGKVVQS